jgi:hypothetical protein
MFSIPPSRHARCVAHHHHIARNCHLLILITTPRCRACYSGVTKIVRLVETIRPDSCKAIKCEFRDGLAGAVSRMDPGPPGPACSSFPLRRSSWWDLGQILPPGTPHLGCKPPTPGATAHFTMCTVKCITGYSNVCPGGIYLIMGLSHNWATGNSKYPII